MRKSRVGLVWYVPLTESQSELMFCTKCSLIESQMLVDCRKLYKTFWALIIISSRPIYFNSTFVWHFGTVTGLFWLWFWTQIVLCELIMFSHLHVFSGDYANKHHLCVCVWERNPHEPDYKMVLEYWAQRRKVGLVLTILASVHRSD